MIVKPSLEEAKTLANGGEYTILPLSCELFSDSITPIEALKRLKDASSHCYMLESVENSQRWGRYTFLGYDPKLHLTASNGVVTITGPQGDCVEASNPGSVIRRLLRQHKSPRLSYLPPFTGGLVGYFSYDYIKYAEPSLALSTQDPEGFFDVNLKLFDKVIAFDHYRQKIVLMVNVPCANLEESYRQGVQQLEELRALLHKARPTQDFSGRMTSPLQALFSKEKYCAMVERAKEYIREGDIFQVVLSNRLHAEFTGSLLDTYRVLRTTNPSPYMFYFSSEDLEIAGASPETLVKLEDGVLHTFPLAGTRPRGQTPKEDEALQQELLADEKERAEHNMLVDLGRNDLGKISRFGSVQVEEYMQVHRYSHVMHIGSVVRGELRPDCDALNAVEAVLPAGTLSGAPKIRACQIIEEQEGDKRGIYGGAIGYLDFTGNLDTCIAIRLAVKKNGKVFVRAGAGIVADSVPETEYQECINKAKAVVRALELAQEGVTP